MLLLNCDRAGSLVDGTGGIPCLNDNVVTATIYRETGVETSTVRRVRRNVIDIDPHCRDWLSGFGRCLDVNGLTRHLSRCRRANVHTGNGRGA